MVSFLVPLRRTASIRCSGTPQRPKPPTRMVAPSLSLAMAASAEAMRLSMVSRNLSKLRLPVRHTAPGLSQKNAMVSPPDRLEFRTDCAEGPPTRVFCKKSLEVADSRADDFFGDDKESARVLKEWICHRDTPTGSGQAPRTEKS